MTIEIPAWVDGQLVPVDKLEAHVKGLRHKAVSVFVIRDGQVLIQRRALGKYHTPGLWANTCCTHPDWDEASLDCAQRRLSEELGITGLVPDYRDRVEYRADVGGGLIEHEVVDIFVADAGADMPLVPNPEEVMDTAWVSYGALLEQVKATPARFTPWLRIYLDTYADRIFSPEMLAQA
ncbi:isopentenyl-diphosphate Delta-isomerase [Thalassococcus sp. BH17M4-6]|uniref:isopentenyl-diphosphate Delta-isomerase n=1 Tax=Thalassococcus sp. BH17M4-6 TaxID=3413148 RepID=UPI003BEB1F0E